MKEERRRNRKRKRSSKHEKSSSNDTPIRQNDKEVIVNEPQIPPSSSSSSSKRSKSSSFLDKMKARLAGGYFRMINEKLYTCTGEDALNYFKEDPSLFDVYHTGYREQMEHWPEQPLNVIMKWIQSRIPSLVVADFGCGDARLAKSVKNKVFSIDLLSNDPSVIACDMSNTPLDNSAVDVAVFCLSLMGTNYPNFIQEANRVLRPGGWLLIAEVKSRFDPNTGGADPNKFSEAICDLGFTLTSKDVSNKMFILFYFQKKARVGSKVKESHWPELKPCLYKRR